jgi:class 3 adenylate cyclase
VSSRAIQLQFGLTTEQLAGVSEELPVVRELAVDKDGKMLVWKSGNVSGSAPSEARRSAALVTPSATYTPPHLSERILAEQAALEARGNTDGERKIITALFADLKGSTALIEGLDPEEARAIIDPTLQLMMDAVHRYEGYMAQALGDGIFAVFGFPIAHEDHPQQALYAALRIQKVACCVLRGLGQGDLAWLPGGIT